MTTSVTTIHFIEVMSTLEAIKFNIFGVGVSCRSLYSIVSYLYVSWCGSITLVGEERVNLSAIIYL